MSYTKEDFRRDYYATHQDELLRYLSPQARLKGVSPDEIVRQFSPEEILRQFSPDERLKGLSREEIEMYLKKLREQHDSN